MSKKHENTSIEQSVSTTKKAEKRPKRMKRLIISAAVVVIIAILAVVGWSIYNFQIKPYTEVAIRVNDVTFDMRYYINTQKIYYGNAPTEYSINQFSDYVEEQIFRNQVLIQGSKALGVEIKRSEIEALLRSMGQPTTPEYVDIKLAEELLKDQVPETQPQANVQAILVESESAAQEAIDRIEAGESFVDVAANMSKIEFSKIIHGEMGWVTPREIELKVDSEKFDDIVFNTETDVLSGPVYDETTFKLFGYWVFEVLEKVEPTDNISVERVKALGIFVGSEQDANEVIDKLNAGEDWNELAKQVSLVPGAEENGADLGWISKTVDTTSYDAIFDLPLNTVSTPISYDQIETQGGYWVYNIVDRNDDRELTSNQENLLVDDYLNRCTIALQIDPDFFMESLLTQDMKDFAFNETVSSLGPGSVIIRDESIPPGEAGVDYHFQFEVWGNKKGNTWSIIKGGLPNGLSLDSSKGIISGTPKTAGGYSLTIEVNNGIHYWRNDFTMRIYLPVSITTTSLPDGQVDVEYSELLEVFGDRSSFSWSVVSGNLPDGLELSQYSGSISGTPSTSGVYEFTVEVDDGIGKATQSFSLTIQ